MTFSELAAQQRTKELKSLRRFITCSLTGSVLVHSGFLFAQIQPFQQSEEIEPIEIVVTEPPPRPTQELSPEPSPQAQTSDPQVAPQPAAAAARPNLPSQTPLQPQPQTAPAPPTVEATPASPAEVPVQTIETDDPEAPSVREAMSEAMSTAPTVEGPVGFVGKTSGPTGDANSPPGIPSGEGTGLSAAPGSSTAPGTGDTPQRGSRQIACRSCPEPDYPEEALRAGAEGSVRVNVDVDSNGRVVGVTLTGSSGNAAIDRAVIETVRRRYQFEGVGAGGASIPLEVDMTVQGSERNRNARRRGDRRRITVTEETPAPGLPRREEATAGSDTPRSPDPTVDTNTVNTNGTGSDVRSPATPIPDNSPTASPSPSPADIGVPPSPVATPTTVETPQQPLRLEAPPPPADIPRREAQPAPPPVESPPVNPAPAVQVEPQLPPEPPALAPPPPVAAPEPAPVAPAQPGS